MNNIKEIMWGTSKITLTDINSCFGNCSITIPMTLYIEYMYHIIKLQNLEKELKLIAERQGQPTY